MYLAPREECSTTEYSIVSLTATARLDGMVHGVVVHTDTASPPPPAALMYFSTAGVASVT